MDTRNSKTHMYELTFNISFFYLFLSIVSLNELFSKIIFNQNRIQLHLQKKINKIDVIFFSFPTILHIVV